MASLNGPLASSARLLWLVAKRDVRSLSTVVTNNLFLCALFLIQGAQGKPHHAFWNSLLFQIILLLPLLAAASSDVINRIPAERFALWPLTSMQRLWLRWFSLLLNPAVWLLVVLYTFWIGIAIAIAFLGVALCFQALAMMAAGFSRHGLGVRPLVPRFPGAMGGIVQVELRNIFRTLDFYAALLLGVTGAAYRFCGREVQPEAFPVLALMIALTLSTFAQRTFALDSLGGTARYRLMPVAGWKLLLAKDAAFLVVTALLVLPLNLRAGIAFAIVALAVGRYPSLRQSVRQRPWRFTGGDIRFCLAQVFLGGLAGVAVVRVSLWAFVPILAIYVASLYAGDRWWKGRA